MRFISGTARIVKVYKFPNALLYYADNSEHRFNRLFTNENNASFFGFTSVIRVDDTSRNRDQTLYLGRLVRSNSRTNSELPLIF